MLTTIKTSFPATLTPAFSPATVWKKLGDLWCRFFHDAWMWPIHGETQCRTCGRRRPVSWAHSDAGLCTSTLR